MQNVDGGGECAHAGMGHSTLSVQFSCESKTTLKNKVYVKNKKGPPHKKAHMPPKNHEASYVRENWQRTHHVRNLTLVYQDIFLVPGFTMYLDFP